MRNPLPKLLGLCVVPVIGFTIAAVDSRLGFRLLMASLGMMMLVLIVALFLRTRGLRPGTIRVAAEGELRLMPSRGHRFGVVAVPLAMLLPVLALWAVGIFDLPTQESSSRLMALLPIALLATSLGSLAMVVWSMRIPTGMRIGAAGLAGVRGGGAISLRWDELRSVALLGEYGPKLVLTTRAGDAVVLDAHHLGSDPAIVADVVEHYRKRPSDRVQLADGCDAISTVEAALAASGN